LYFPNENYFHSEIERYNLSNDTIDFYKQHLSSKPILDNKSNRDAIYHAEGKYYYWITQKLFKENFLIFKDEDFWCSVDPILDAEIGTDLSADSTTRMYWNTRGIRVQARFYDKVAFTTSIYENQAIVPEYQSSFFNQNGEFRPTNLGYKQNNAFIPMYARTKPFKVTGYDFAFAEGTLSIVPKKWLNFQLGNGNQFIGNGYRSLFLSDFSGNYPFLKSELLAFNGKLQYQVIYASLTNPYRLSVFSTPEASYERKIGVFHYLDYTINKDLNISLFEGSNWRSTDSSGTHRPNYLFLNPVIASNSLIKGSDANNYNSILGFGADYTLGKTKFYTQFLLDNNKVSTQLGLKSYDLFIDKLDIRLEYNQSPNNSYLTTNKRYNYAHNNISLAHPFVAGFKEIVGIVSYQRNRWFAHNKVVFYTKKKNDSLNIGTSLLQPYSDKNNEHTVSPYVINNQFEIGYRFNKSYNLQIVIGHLYRNEIIGSTRNQTNYVYFGVKTKLRNKKLDW
jgi:hypothetical protein